jgi:hypothetical protein
MSDGHIYEITGPADATDEQAYAEIIRQHPGIVLSLKHLRAAYPQYNDLSDEQLAEKFYNKHHAKLMSREEFDQKFHVGYPPLPPGFHWSKPQ